MTDEQADRLLQANNWSKWSDARWLLKVAARIGAEDAAAELNRLHHNNKVLMDALLKSCGDDLKAVNAIIESQGELK